jgi:hypothetical protein
MRYNITSVHKSAFISLWKVQNIDGRFAQFLKAFLPFYNIELIFFIM